MSGAVKDAALAKAGAMPAQPRAHVPPRHDGINAATEVKNRQRGATCDGPEIVVGDQMIAARHRLAITWSKAAFHKFSQLLAH